MPEGQGGAIEERRVAIETRSAEYSRPLVTPLQHFYRTSALPCPYLDGKLERKLITELAGRDAKSFYDDLCRAGFRRSHHLAYRPSCAGCAGCVPVRVAALAFCPTRSTRRVARINADIEGRETELRATAEQYRLFVRYERTRHAGSEMAAMTFGDYRAMIEDSPIDTRIVEFRDPRRILVGACIIDALDDGYSAVYSFFDPLLARRSLGTFMVLWLVEDARRRGLPYIYLGYWIAESDKMSYKTRFRPLESLGAQGWQPFSP
ncbi:MAG TPA: arginyltransferase [Stellaceae bacterium]|nr:arginyltransferase [Stellaceae bacterium]